jgi:sulfonate transport system substrate-binding protein
MTSNKSTRRTVLKTITGSAAGFAAASIAPRRSAAQDTPTITLGTLPINPVLGSYIGEVDIFNQQGLSVERTRFNNFAPILQGMTTGTIAVGDIGLAPSIIGLSRGLPLIVPFLSAYVTPRHPFERIMVMPNSPIKTLDDLKGKKLAFLGPGTVPDMLLDALPLKTAIKKQDIQLIPMPAPGMPDALGQGVVDAIFAIPPGDAVAERKYGARTVANIIDLVPYAGLSTIVVRRDFAEANPKATKKIYRACIGLSRWIGDNTMDARKVMGSNLGLPTELAVAARIPLFSRNGMPVMPDVWNIYEMLVRSKAIDPHPDPVRLFNDAIVEPTKRFILPVVEELGTQPDPEIESMLKGEYPFLPNPVASYYSDWERRLLKL